MAQTSSSAAPFLPATPTSLTSIAFLPSIKTDTPTSLATPNFLSPIPGTGKHGISSGAVAGIIIGAVAILLLIFTFISLEISRGFFSKSRWVSRGKIPAQSDVEIKVGGIQNKKYMEVGKEKEKEAEAEVWQDIPLPPPPPAYNDTLSGAQHA